MRILAFVAILAVLTNPAHAALGFGSTYGAGTTDAVTPNASIANPTTAVTYSFWFWRNGAGGGSSGAVLRSSVGTGIIFTTTTTLGFNYPFSSVNGVWAVNLPSNSAWHHMAISYDPTSTSNTPLIYIDGVSQSRSSSSQPAGTVTTTANLIIGNNTSTGGIRGWDGMLADFVWWSGILTANEVGALAHGASPLEVRPTALLYYFPLSGAASNEPDWGPTHTMTTKNGTKFQPDPPKQPFPLIKYSQ